MTTVRAAPSNARTPAAGLARRIGAMFYDALILIASWMVVTALVLTFSAGEPITPATAGPFEWAYRLLLVAVAVAYFGHSWTRSGQTVGMAAWRLQIVREDGRLPCWPDALRRLTAAGLSAAPLGLGYLWMLVDRDRLAWHDRLSRTRIVVLPKR